MTAVEAPAGRLGLPADDGATQQADDLTLYSVTTIIGALEKPALLYWSAEQTALAAVREQRTWQAMLADRGEDETVKWLRDARFRRPRDLLSAADLGTCFHTVGEEYALTGQRPDRARIEQAVADKGGNKSTVANETPVIEAMLDAFDGWLQKFTPEYQATEVCVYSPLYGYAGTADAFITVDGVRFIVDYKTSRKHLDARGNLRKPYPEQSALQLAAYRNATMAAVWRPRRTERFKRRFYLLGPDEQAVAVPVPEVDTGLIIQVSPESCHDYPVKCGPDVFNYFLHTLECFRWLSDESKNVMSEPLEEPS